MVTGFKAQSGGTCEASYDKPTPVEGPLGVTHPDQATWQNGACYCKPPGEGGGEELMMNELS